MSDQPCRTRDAPEHLVQRETAVRALARDLMASTGDVASIQQCISKCLELPLDEEFCGSPTARGSAEPWHRDPILPTSPYVR